MAAETRKCAKCGLESEVHPHQVINVGAEPELKAKVLSGELFLWTCPGCGFTNLLSHPTVYHDPAQKILVWLAEDDFAARKAEAVFDASEELHGYCSRIVGSVGELIEKVKILDAGLDDCAVEMCKYITGMELGKDVDLKFLRMEGAESDILLTYPEKGQMQMLKLGFNVYEDCVGIITRNPAVKPEGLKKVDKNYIKTYFK